VQVLPCFFRLESMFRENVCVVRVVRVKVKGCDDVCGLLILITSLSFMVR
jgi:hypothetical protein